MRSLCVEFTQEPEGDGDVVCLAYAVHLSEEPEPLLCEGEGDALVPHSRHDRGQFALGGFSDPVGQIGKDRVRKNV